MKNLLLYLLTIIMGILAGCAIHHQSVDGERETLYLKVDKARDVYFACSLDRFQYRPARRVNADTWKITVPGNLHFSYFYIVDGDVYIPDCRLKESDDFGSENCIFIPGM